MAHKSNHLMRLNLSADGDGGRGCRRRRRRIRCQRKLNCVDDVKNVVSPSFYFLMTKSSFKIIFF
jgi:hypothetical protein